MYLELRNFFSYSREINTITKTKVTFKGNLVKHNDFLSVRGFCDSGTHEDLIRSFSERCIIKFLDHL